MPVSLNPLGSQLGEPSPLNTISVNRRRLKTTNKMVEDALIELHTPKGVTLRQVYSFILTNYNLNSLSKVRVNLIKKHLISLRESEDIVNITGKGFSGHFKLVDKNKFIKKIQTIMKQARDNINATRKLNRKNKTAGINESNVKTTRNNQYDQTAPKSKTIKKTARKPPTSTKQIAPVIPRQVTPPQLRNTNTSMFDTPMVTSQVHSSTPFISTLFVPRAPAVNQRANRKKVADNEFGTPRSSLPGKKRRLLKRPE